MQRTILNLFMLISVVCISDACNTTRPATGRQTEIKRLKYLNSYEIPYNFKYNNTTVGGLSGIDYDTKKNLYYLVSDDRSDKNPVRFYTAEIYLSEKGIDSLVFTGVTNMLQPNGNTYPNSTTGRFNTPDPEAIRYDPLAGYLVWSSEGERIVNEKDTVLVNPEVNIINTQGKYMNRFTLPGNLNMQATEKGPRRNGVLEGMDFADNYKTLYVNVEEPLYEDGPRADITDNNSFIRIIKFNTKKRIPTAQYAYKLEPVAHKSVPETAFKINGVPDLLSLGNNKLLLIERSFSTGRIPCTIKLFKVDLDGATDISHITLKDNPSFSAAKKTLLLNMDDLGIYTDNIEGVTFGPVLPNGRNTLIFIADNNFSIVKKTQVLLFEVLE